MLGFEIHLKSAISFFKDFVVKISTTCIITAEEGGHMPWGLTSIPEDDGNSSIDENSSISDSANSSFIDDFSSISAGSENNSIFSDTSEHSVMSVGFGENPLNVELPIESSNRRDDSNIEFEHFYGESHFQNPLKI